MFSGVVQYRKLFSQKKGKGMADFDTMFSIYINTFYFHVFGLSTCKGIINYKRESITVQLVA